jgi:hypothetical protein
MQSRWLVITAVAVILMAVGVPVAADTYYELGVPDGGGGFDWYPVEPLLFPDPDNPGQFLTAQQFYDWAPPVPLFWRSEFGSTTPNTPGYPRHWGLTHLQDNMITCFIYGNDEDIPISLFCIYGEPNNDGANTRHIVNLTLSGLPPTATTWVQKDDMPVSDDSFPALPGGDPSPAFTVMNTWTEWYTDGFVIGNLEPTGDTSQWYYDILFDMDFIENPLNEQVAVQWLSGDATNPTVIPYPFGYDDDNDNFEIDWILRITPEPATTALFVTGLSALGLYIRRRRKQ